MDRLIAQGPVYGPADLSIDAVGEDYKVYTHRAFKKETLVLCPDTNDLKSRKWTQQRSVLVKNGSDLHPNHDLLVLDGRSRANPRDGHIFSMFFLVERTLVEDILRSGSMAETG